MRAALTLAVASMLAVTTMATTAFADSQSNPVQIRYEPPKDPEHGPIYEELKRLRALEKLQGFVSPFRLPRTLTIIGAHALSIGATLVTNNAKEFRRIRGLRVQDWTR